MAKTFPTTVEVAPFRYSLAPVMRESWKAGDLYIIHNDVRGEERFFIAERVFEDVFGATVRVISTVPFRSVREAYAVAASGQRLFKREVLSIGAARTPSAFHEALRAIVADVARNNAHGVR